MFDETIRELERLERGFQLSIEMPLDDDGYFDRVCPSAECRASFKVLFDDWRDKVADERVFCPVCRHEAPADEWCTDDQTKYIEQVAVSHIEKTINKTLRQDASRFNQMSGRGGFIQMSMNVRPGRLPVVVPSEAADLMRQRFECEECSVRYASVGAAFFCPACGHNSALSMFDRTVEIVQKTVEALPGVREALAAGHDDDVAEHSIRQILEDQLSRLVGAFERLSGALFDELPNRAQFTVRRGVFQRLDEASKLWRNATGSGYEDALGSAAYRELKKLVQQRHVLGHRQGIVDQRYIDESGDMSYAVGQRLVIRETAVVALAELVSKLADELRRLT